MSPVWNVTHVPGCTNQEGGGARSATAPDGGFGGERGASLAPSPTFPPNLVTPTSRRSLLGATALLGAATFLPRTAGARDYTSATEVLDTIDRLAGDVEASLSAIVKIVPGTQPFAASVGADHVREKADRNAIRARLRLPAAAAPVPPAASASTSLDGLRSTQQELVHAHAEGLPALDDTAAVQVLAGHMVEAARRLTVIDLWIELEAERAG
jgi:hypothetical protein